MFRSAASKVVGVGRATVFLVGLAVVLALVFGAAATALAGTGVGAVFNLGKTNTVNAVSQLVGSTTGAAMLKIDNNGTGPALNLIVEPGKTPMWVSSSTKVERLNADTVDGKDSTDFVPQETYTKTSSTTGSCFSGNACLWETYCDSGDTLLSGGYHGVDSGTTVTASVPEDYHNGWYMEWLNDGTADQITVYAYCADQDPAHTS